MQNTRNFPLILLLVLCTAFIVALNLTSLKTILRSVDVKHVEVNDAPIRHVTSNNERPPIKKVQAGGVPIKTKKNTATHEVAGLNCDRYNGPSEEIAAEMVYWRDIPKDAEFISPFADHGGGPKYLTFEPDEGGWNNIRYVWVLLWKKIGYRY